MSYYRNDDKITSYTLESGETINVEDSTSRSVFEYNIMNNIDFDEIEECAESNCNMINEDDCESDVKDIDTDDLVYELNSRGYYVDEEETVDTLDLIDNRRLEEIYKKIIE